MTNYKPISAININLPDGPEPGMEESYVELQRAGAISQKLARISYFLQTRDRILHEPQPHWAVHGVEGVKDYLFTVGQHKDVADVLLEAANLAGIKGQLITEGESYQVSLPRFDLDSPAYEKLCQDLESAVVEAEFLKAEKPAQKIAPKKKIEPIPREPGKWRHDKDLGRDSDDDGNADWWKKGGGPER